LKVGVMLLEVEEPRLFATTHSRESNNSVSHLNTGIPASCFIVAARGFNWTGY
jgi:hypothetical protein